MDPSKSGQCPVPMRVGVMGWVEPGLSVQARGEFGQRRGVDLPPGQDVADIVAEVCESCRARPAEAADS